MLDRDTTNARTGAEPSARAALQLQLRSFFFLLPFFLFFSVSLVRIEFLGAGLGNKATWMSLWRPQTCHHAYCWDVEDLLTGDCGELAVSGGVLLVVRLFIPIV